MALLQIRKYGDPVLRQKAKQIDPIDDEIVKLAEDMIETMQVAKGIGLAAPQIGLSLSMCVVDIGLIEEGASPEAFINPEIIEEFGDDYTMEEGCLSIPEVNDDVTRKEAIRVTYQDINGEKHELSCDGMLARVLQHEIDHLHGIFFTDRLSAIKRKLLAKKLRAIESEAIHERIERNRQRELQAQ
ncbi:MAG: peptide deformylase [Deferribacteres bacterium]|nr:peptide deformylase [candidate division KSB1 bacterium]MCB9512352.1 peptide deformylase [Deferribacteres bacterium]